MHHFWLSKHSYLPSKSLFKTLKKRVTSTSAREFLDELVDNAKLYRSIHEVTYGRWTKQERGIAESLEALALFRVAQPIPCVLSLVREYKLTKKIKLRHLKDALLSIEKFHFLFTAVTSQRSSGGISQMYALHARELHDAKDTQAAVKTISELNVKLRKRVPSSNEFMALFPEIVFTDTISKQRKLVRYILMSIDRYLTTSTVRDYSQLTIEYIASQSQQSGKLPLDVIGQVGNLILVPEELNQKLRNKSFADKKKVLSLHGVQIPKDILAAVDWGKKEIQARTTAIAKMAYEKIWRI